MRGKNKRNNTTPLWKSEEKSIGSNQNGQVLIESLLLMILSVSLLGITVRTFKDSKTFSKLTNKIWAGVAQMGEYGSWPTANQPVHPNSSIRTRLLDPSK